MSQMSSRRTLRWAAPAVVAAGVVVAAVTMNGAGAQPSANLPPKSAAQLVAAVQTARPPAMSGTIVETARLGLPNLPTDQLPGGSGLSLATLFTGSHTMRVWYGGPTQQRIALLAPLSERDVIHNGSDLWSFTSTTNTVTHSTVPQNISSGASDQGAQSDPADPSGRGSSTDKSDNGDGSGSNGGVAHLLDGSPPSVARALLSAITPTTKVSVSKSAIVAGRPVYELELTPRDARSLVGSVRIAIDSATSVPLQVQVYARGTQAPALQIGFTDVSFSQPPASLFDFAPPAGSTVSEQPLSGLLTDGMPSSDEHSGAPGATTSNAQPQVLGTGWTAVVKLPAGASALQGATGGLLDSASTPTPSGRLISTSLLSVLIADNGDVYAGAVSGTALEHVASSGHGL